MKRLRLQKTDLADADIDSISLWIARSSGSIEPALKWLRDLDRKFERLLDAPGSGTRRPDIGPAIRTSPFGNYILFFRSNQEVLEIVRVLHGDRNLQLGVQIE